MCEVVELEGRGVDWIAYAVGRVNLLTRPLMMTVDDKLFDARKELDGRRVRGALTIRRWSGEVVEYNDRLIIMRRAGTPRLPEIVIDELVAQLAAKGAMA